MRLVYIDMHCINFLTNTYSQIKGGTKVKTYKHRFIIDYALKNGIDVMNFVTGDDSTKRGMGRIRKIVNLLGNSLLHKRYIMACLKESKYVLDESYGKDSGIQMITDISQITQDDIVISYIFHEKQREVITRITKGHKVMMGNHFVALNEPYDLHEANIQAFVNEIDLSDNTFVKKYLNCEGIKNITCPYIFADRFVDLGKERKNKAMGVGTLSTCKGNPGYKLYREEFGTEWIQLMRKEIYDHAEEYPEQIDSYVSYIFEDKKEIKEGDSILKKTYKILYNRRTGWTQSKYTSFNMVEKFNEYMMFVCPEELVGMPGIGFVEGMACGTAYIGLDTPYYRNLGLIPGQHYISYDGTMKGLIEVIRYYQERPDDIKRIAKTGMKFVRENFNTEIVAKRFFEELRKLS